MKPRRYGESILHAGAVPTLPSSPTPGPVVLVIHGGDWNHGSPFLVDIEKVCEELSTAGFWVFAGDYPARALWSNHEPARAQ